MKNAIKDPEFEKAVDQIVDSIQLSGVSFALGPWETVVGLVGAFFEGSTTPNRVIIRFALNGLAL
ncbi:MAG: hypothetical protein ACN4G0_08205 [Polyangiales bacterium]